MPTNLHDNGSWGGNIGEVMAVDKPGAQDVTVMHLEPQVCFFSPN